MKLIAPCVLLFGTSFSLLFLVVLLFGFVLLFAFFVLLCGPNLIAASESVRVSQAP